MKKSSGQLKPDIIVIQIGQDLDYDQRRIMFDLIEHVHGMSFDYEDSSAYIKTKLQDEGGKYWQVVICQCPHGKKCVASGSNLMHVQVDRVHYYIWKTELI